MDAASPGQAALLAAFRTFCLDQFEADRREGDAHLAARDAPALRRVAHNLASVLATLAEPDAAACARQLEAALLAGEWPTATADWQRMRCHLLALTAAAPTLRERGPHDGEAPQALRGWANQSPA